MHEISPLVKKHGDRRAASLKDKESCKKTEPETHVSHLYQMNNAV